MLVAWTVVSLIFLWPKAMRGAVPLAQLAMIAFVVSATAKVDLMKVYRGTAVLIIAILAVNLVTYTMMNRFMRKYH